jgi:hypothetical protein
MHTSGYLCRYMLYVFYERRFGHGFQRRSGFRNYDD